MFENVIEGCRKDHPKRANAVLSLKILGVRQQRVEILFGTAVPHLVINSNPMEVGACSPCRHQDAQADEFEEKEPRECPRKTLPACGRPPKILLEFVEWQGL